VQNRKNNAVYLDDKVRSTTRGTAFTDSTTQSSQIYRRSNGNKETHGIVEIRAVVAVWLSGENRAPEHGFLTSG